MKDEPQNPWIDPELEARIVHLVLGEASDLERDQLEQLIAEHPELATFMRQMEAVHGLLGEVAAEEQAAADDSWELSDDRRNEVLAAIGGAAVEQPTINMIEGASDAQEMKQHSSFIGNLGKVAAVIGIVGIMSGLLLPAGQSARESSRKAAVLNNMKQQGLGLETYSEPVSESEPEVSDGATLPRPYYLSDDVQFFSPGDPAKDSVDGFQAESKSALAAIRGNLESSGIAPSSDDYVGSVPSGEMNTNSGAEWFGDRVGGDVDAVSEFFNDGDVARSAESVNGGLFSQAPAAAPYRLDLSKGLEDQSADGGSLAMGEARIELDVPFRGNSFSTDQVKDQAGANAHWGMPAAGQPAGVDQQVVDLDGPVDSSDAFDVLPETFSWHDRRSERSQVSAQLQPESSQLNKGSGVADESRSRRQLSASELPLGFEAGLREYKITDRSGGLPSGGGFGGGGGGGFGGGGGRASSVANEGESRSDPVSVETAPANPSPTDGASEAIVGTDISLGLQFSLPKQSSSAGPEEMSGGANLYARAAGPKHFESLERFREPADGNGDRFGALSGSDAAAKQPAPQIELPKLTNMVPGATIAVPEGETVVSGGRKRLSQVHRGGTSAESETSKEARSQENFSTTTGDSTRELRERIRSDQESRDADFSEIRKPDAKSWEENALVSRSDFKRLNINAYGGLRGESAGEPLPAAKQDFDGEEYGIALERKGLQGQSGQSKLGISEELGTIDPSTEAAETRRNNLNYQPSFSTIVESQDEAVVWRKKHAPGAVLDERLASSEAFSTFSLHVGDVSFKLAQTALAQGKWPEAARVRVEEFVNAFDYGDPMPRVSEKVACRTEQAIHPFLQQRNLLRISLRTAASGRASQTPLRLTFLLDNSGSMERIDRQQTVRRAFALLAHQLTPADQVTLVSFARQPRLLADKVSGGESARLIQLIENLPSEGGTNFEAALSLAFEKAREQYIDGAQNRVILLTDGAANLGDADPESLAEKIVTMRNDGIAFDAAGIGADGLNDEILEALTRNGDGRYYLLDRPEDADEGFARQIAGALRPAAKNVKVQIEFNPSRVGRYKLLGFEKHRLKKEDFRNDKVDAAEMAAAEAGVAVYQFEAKPDGQGDIGSVSVRFRDMSTGQMVEKRWPIPFEANAPRAQEAAPSMRVATAASLLAARLRGEPLGESVDLQTLASLIETLPEQYLSATRVQQLQQMIQQARQLSGQ